MAEKASDILRRHDPENKHKRYELTSEPVRHLAGKGLHDPSALTPHEIRELCASVLAHLVRHHD